MSGWLQIDIGDLGAPVISWKPNSGTGKGGSWGQFISNHKQNIFFPVILINFISIYKYRFNESTVSKMFHHFMSLQTAKRHTHMYTRDGIK